MGFTPGISKVSDLSDVVLNNPANTQVLSFNAGNWRNAAAGSGGSVTAANITDATTLGRTVLTAANAAAIKTAAGITNVDNTSDANKPVSTAVQTALNGKVTQAGSGSLRMWPASTTFPTTGMQVGDLFPHIEEV